MAGSLAPTGAPDAAQLDRRSEGLLVRFELDRNDTRRRERAEDFYDAADTCSAQVMAIAAGSSAGDSGGGKNPSWQSKSPNKSASAPRRKSSTPPRAGF